MLKKLQDLPMITTNLLLYDDINVTFEQNRIVFEAVQEFLKVWNGDGFHNFTLVKCPHLHHSCLSIFFCK